MELIYTDGTYRRNNPTWHEEDSAWKAGHVLRLLERSALAPASVCDIGCGAGGILRELSVRLPGARLVGYDIAPEAHAIASRKASGNLSFRLGTPLGEDVFFDLALAIDVFEHVEDYFAFLRRLRPRARHKVFHIPLELSVQAVLRSRPLMEARRRVGHIHHFNRETALAALEDTGYEVLDSFYTSARTELSNVGWKSALLRWPRRIAQALSPDFSARVLGGYGLMVLAH